MRVVDDALLGVPNPTTGVRTGGILQALPFPVYDIQAQIDPLSDVKVTVSYPVPFATYTSSVGDDDNRRLGGSKSRRSVFFSLTYVGIDRTQAKAAGEHLRATLQRRRLVVAGHRFWPIDLQVSNRIRADHNIMRPDGSPLFYGIDDYAVSLALTQGAPA